MTHLSRRWLGAGLFAGGCAGLLGMMSAFSAAFAFAGDDTALIMGYLLTPNPGEGYLNQVNDLFIDPKHPFPGQLVFSGYDPVIQNTNEIDFQSGLDQGVVDLNKGIMDHLADGGKVVVFGYSQSTSIATQEMINLASLPAGQAPSPDDLSFVLVEDLNSPNGGTFERFDSPIQSWNLPATPADTPYPTAIYNIEYSGVSDLPNYASNPFAMANSVAAYFYDHPFLVPGWPSTFDTAALADAVELPTSAGYDGSTHYFLIPTQDLPMLAGLRDTPVVGPALADLIQPDLRVLVDLGYDRASPADVVTKAAAMPNIDWDTVMHNLELGAQQGWTAFQVHMGMLPQSDLPDIYPFVPDLSGLIADPSMTGLEV